MERRDHPGDGGSRAAVVSLVADDASSASSSPSWRPGPDATAVETDSSALTGLYVKELTTRRDGSVDGLMYYYRAGSAATAVSPESLRTPAAARVLAEAALVHTTGITPAISAGARAAQDALFADGRPWLSFDLNWRSALWRGRLDEARRVLGGYMTSADIVQCSAADAEELLGTGDPDRLREMFPAPRHLVITRDDGAVAFDGQERTEAASVEAPVVETIGGGDAFAVGFLAGVLADLSLAGCLARAHRLAARALATTRDHVD